MKIHNKLDEIFTQGPKIKILRFLFNNDARFTGRAIAMGANLSVSHSYEVLQEMRREGLVDAERQGNAILYSLRKDSHVFKNIIKPLFEKEKGIYEEVISAIKKFLLPQKNYISSIAVFGSVANRQDTSTSDIDLLVVTKDTGGKKKIDASIDNLNGIMARRFSTMVSPYILTQSELRNKHKKRLSLIESIIDNNRLIYGEPIERIIA